MIEKPRLFHTTPIMNTAMKTCKTRCIREPQRAVREFEPRTVNWPVPVSTRHREYTVTDMCYLIEAGTPCSGCTMMSSQQPDPSIIVETDRPAQSEDRYRFNVPFVKEIAQKQVDQGINLLTYQGGEPLTFKGFEEIIKWTADHPILNAVIYSSSSYYFDRHDRLNKRFFQHEQAGLFSHDFGYFKASTDVLITDKRHIPAKGHPLRGEAFKSYYGLKLAETLVKMGYEPAIHLTLKKSTLVHALPLYKWARDRGIRFSLCPMVWNLYVCMGRDRALFTEHLTTEHTDRLHEIVDYLATDTENRFFKGQKRIYVPSSGFTRLMPEYGPMNRLSCREHRQHLQPNGQDIHPNGQERWCIAQNTQDDGADCPGCFYIGIDRGDSDYWHFEQLAGLHSSDLRWLNADVWTKDPQYDPSGVTLFFDHTGEPLQQTWPEKRVANYS